MDVSFEELTDSQKEACRHKDGALLVFAGAGAGKTTVLKHRYEKLLEKGVKPSNILLTTFTNNASDEIEDRIEGIEDSDETHIGTVHSNFLNLLKGNKKRFGFDPDKTLGIYNEFDQTDIIAQLIREELVDSDSVDQKLIEDTARVIGNNINNVRKELIMPHEVENAVKEGEYELTRQIGSQKFNTLDNLEQLFFKVFKGYREEMRDNNRVDFTGMLFFSYLVLEEDPEFRERYSEKFQYIIVDEAQDLSRLEWKLFDLLAEQHGNLCLIADDMQAIYNWRGADHTILRDFREKYDTKVVKLKKNFRSSTQILETVNDIATKLNNVEQKLLDSHKGELDESRGQPAVERYAGSEDEIHQIAQKIAYLVEEEDVPSEEIGVLSRRNRNLFKIENALRFDHNIPVYNASSNSDFSEQDEVKYVSDFLQAYISPDDDLIIGDMIETYVGGVGKKKVAKLKEEADDQALIEFIGELPEDNSISGLGSKNTKKIHQFVDFVKNLDTFDSPIAEIMDSQGIWKNKIASSMDWNKDRLDNINEIKQELDKRSFDPSEVADFLEDLSLGESKDEHKEKVWLSSIHGAKGKEWRNVFLFEVNENVFPAYNSDNIEEEKRLFYVAISRAKQKCFISYHQTDNGKMKEPSQFLGYLSLDEMKANPEIEAQEI